MLSVARQEKTRSYTSNQQVPLLPAPPRGYERLFSRVQPVSCIQKPFWAQLHWHDRRSASPICDSRLTKCTSVKSCGKSVIRQAVADSRANTDNLLQSTLRTRRQPCSLPTGRAVSSILLRRWSIDSCPPPTCPPSRSAGPVPHPTPSTRSGRRERATQTVIGGRGQRVHMEEYSVRSVFNRSERCD